MAARRGASVTIHHAEAVASGVATLAEIADSLHISRQSLWEIFKRRGWSTRAAATPVGDKSQDSPGVGQALGAPTEPARRRSAPAAPSLPPSPSSPASAASGAAQIPIFDEASHADLLALARAEVANAALLGIGHVRDLLSKPIIGPAGLRSVMAALAVATEQLSRIGFDVAGEVDQGVPVLRIEEFTAKELAEIQAQAEREHQGISPVDDDDVT